MNNVFFRKFARNIWYQWVLLYLFNVYFIFWSLKHNSKKKIKIENDTQDLERILSWSLQIDMESTNKVCRYLHPCLSLLIHTFFPTKTRQLWTIYNKVYTEFNYYFTKLIAFKTQDHICTIIISKHFFRIK